MYKVRPVKLLTLFALLISSPLLAIPVGEHAGEIWIDGPENIQVGNPKHVDAAVDTTGRSIFVWATNPAVNGGTRIHYRVFPSDGGAPSVPALVGPPSEFNQQYPRVAISKDGSFLVVWQSDEVPEGATAKRKVVRSQAFDANAQAVGSEQLLSTLPPRGTTSISADVAALTGGGYVVAWSSRETSGDDTDWSIQARRVGADGAPLAAQFQVNSNNSAGGETNSSITELADGGFLIVWTIVQINGHLQGRRFTANGTPVGDDVQIATTSLGSASETEATLHEDGRVLIIWKDEEDTDNSWEIRGRLYSQNLAAQGPDFRINEIIAGAQQQPRAADYGEAGFFVVWESGTSSGDDDDPTGIEGRIVTGSNQFSGAQFQVNEWIQDSQQSPGIGGIGGRVAIGWDSQSRPGSINSAILGQFWSICGIFCDSFEGEQ
mgnify:CR=1 FL=1